jgi:hypothetical protein
MDRHPIERRAAELARALPLERPWRRGRRLSGGTAPSWELHPDELREAPRPGRSLGVDMTPLIRRLLAQVTRDPDDGAGGDRDLAERNRKEEIRAPLEAALNKLREAP